MLTSGKRSKVAPRLGEAVFFNVRCFPMSLCTFPALGAISEPLWGHFRAILGPSWRPRGHLGAILGSCWGHLGALEAISGSLGSVLAPYGPISGAFWGFFRPSWGRLGALWTHLGSFLGPLQAIMGPFACILESSRDQFETTSNHHRTFWTQLKNLQPCWADLPASWSHLGAS